MHGDNYADVRLSQRVLYVDEEKETHHAIVVDDVPGRDYVTLVHGGTSELGETYHSSVETETSVYLHNLLADEDTESAETHAFLPLRWEYEGEWEDPTADDEDDE